LMDLKCEQWMGWQQNLMGAEKEHVNGKEAAKTEAAAAH